MSNVSFANDKLYTIIIAISIENFAFVLSILRGIYVRSIVIDVGYVQP